MSNLMKTLTIGDASYEICDASAREALEKIGTGVSSWNDLGYSYSVMTWDGTTDERECFTTPTPAGWSLNYYKISDTYLPADKFVGGTMTVSGVEDINSFAESQGNGEVLPAEVQITEDMIVFADNGYAVVGMFESIPLIMSVTAEYAESQSINISEGTYALLAEAEVVNQLFAELGAALTLKDNIFLTELKIIEKINLIPEDLIPEISWKNLSDKPFYEDGSVREVLIKPATYDVNATSGTVKRVYFYDLERQLEDGEIYTIVIDGKEYVETAKRYDSSTVDYVYIGDINVVTSEAEGWCFNNSYNDLGECFKYLNVRNNTEEEWGSFNVALYKGVSEYHTLDEKFIPDTIARKSDLVNAGGVSSWNDLTDKPFYSNGMVEKVLLEESTFENPEDDGVEYCDELIVVPDLVPGNTYTVIWDNVEYECTAVLHSDGATVLGNLSFYNRSNEDGEPFCIWEVYDAGVYYGIITYTSGSHTIKITGAVEDVHKIDPKYLPDGVGYKTSEIKTLVDKTVEVIGNNQILNDNGPIAFVSGEAYDVTFNGEKYSCIANPHAESGGVFLGNGALIGVTMANEDVPFCCVSVPTGEAILFADTGTHAIKIDGVVENIHQIDSKYLKLKKLSFSGYSSGTYDGTDTLNIRIPSPPYIQQSMTDLVAGESPLSSGAIYLVYE